MSDPHGSELPKTRRPKPPPLNLVPLEHLKHNPPLPEIRRTPDTMLRFSGSGSTVDPHQSPATNISTQSIASSHWSLGLIPNSTRSDMMPVKGIWGNHTIGQPKPITLTNNMGIPPIAKMSLSGFSSVNHHGSVHPEAMPQTPTSHDDETHGIVANPPRTYPVAHGDFSTPRQAADHPREYSARKTFENITFTADSRNVDWQHNGYVPLVTDEPHHGKNKDAEIDDTEHPLRRIYSTNRGDTSPHYLDLYPQLKHATVPSFAQKAHARSFKNVASTAIHEFEEAFPGAYEMVCGLNPDLFTMTYGTRVINIKTDSVENLHRGLQLGRWSTHGKVSERIMVVYENQKVHNEKILFLFAVNGSKSFCALAEMTGAWNPAHDIPEWTGPCSGSFPVTWIFAKNVTYGHFMDIKQDRNDQPVINMWNGMTIDWDTGRKVIETYAGAMHFTNALCWPKTSGPTALGPHEIVHVARRSSHGGQRPSGQSSRQQEKKRAHSHRQEENLTPVARPRQVMGPVHPPIAAPQQPVRAAVASAPSVSRSQTQQRDGHHHHGRNVLVPVVNAAQQGIGNSLPNGSAPGYEANNATPVVGFRYRNRSGTSSTDPFTDHAREAPVAPWNSIAEMARVDSRMQPSTARRDTSSGSTSGYIVSSSQEPSAFGAPLSESSYPSIMRETDSMAGYTPMNRIRSKNMTVPRMAPYVQSRAPWIGCPSSSSSTTQEFLEWMEQPPIMPVRPRSQQGGTQRTEVPNAVESSNNEQADFLRMLADKIELDAKIAAYRARGFNENALQQRVDHSGAVTPPGRSSQQPPVQMINRGPAGMPTAMRIPAPEASATTQIRVRSPLMAANSVANQLPLHAPATQRRVAHYGTRELRPADLAMHADARRRRALVGPVVAQRPATCNGYAGAPASSSSSSRAVMERNASIGAGMGIYYN